VVTNNVTKSFCLFNRSCDCIIFLGNGNYNFLNDFFVKNRFHSRFHLTNYFLYSRIIVFNGLRYFWGIEITIFSMIFL